jgi:hypothetical protein
VRDHVLIILIATLMSMVGNHLLGTFVAELVFPVFHPLILLISNVVWITAYHLWIKRGTRLHEKLMLAIGVPFVGTFMVHPLGGLVFFFYCWWIFIPISFATVCLLSLVARPIPPTT